jgi:thiamine pyrophosphate-dependent acetolactate synthase large subunit-like protein
MAHKHCSKHSPTRGSTPVSPIPALRRCSSNDSYGILNIELARVREGDPNDNMLSMLRIDNPSLDWVNLAEAQGVPATRATTAEEFHSSSKRR